jgi:hypothetical protein
MKLRWGALGICVAAGIGLFFTWASGGLAGRPVLPVSDPGGSGRVFATSETQALRAISNAFRLFRYHDMMLTEAVGSDSIAENWHPTNGFVLLPTLSVLATVPTRGVLGTRQLEYLATFHITTAPVGTNRTMINVRSVSGKVLDGIAFGNGGTVANAVKVRPIRREEENVLAAIELELNEKANGSVK